MSKPRQPSPERSLEEISRLVEENMALAHYFANKWQHLDRDEALSIALDGLLRAAQDWQPVRNVPFGSYASLIISWRSNVYAKRRAAKRRGGGTATMVSLDACLTEGTETTFGSLFADERAAQPDTDQLTPEILTPLLCRLKPKEREVIERRFGINGHQEDGLREVAVAMTLTYQRIQQIEKFALTKLRAWIEGKAAPTGETRKRNRCQGNAPSQ